MAKPVGNGSRSEEIDLEQLTGVGPRLAEKLQRLGISAISDLLFHLPIRYENHTRITPVSSIKPGQASLIEGVIVASDILQAGRRSLLCRVEDNTGMINLRFFHFNRAQSNSFCKGTRIRCYGEPRPGSSGLEMYHPQYQLQQGGKLPALDTSLTPVYSTTEGISQYRLRQLITQAFKLSAGRSLPELLPTGYLPEGSSLSLAQAIQFLHQPPAKTTSSEALSLLEQRRHPVQLRLAFEELVAHHLALLQLRRGIQIQRAPKMTATGKLTQPFCRNLAFKLTSAQKRVASEIAADLDSKNAMLRLVQGDVGSGKTAVAAMAAMQAAEAGFQTALMAPTELLAEQHFKSFQAWGEGIGIGVAYLTGKQKTTERRCQAKLISEGKVQIVIGTHALFQQQVVFKRLGLIIIDEQHRFGVHQRLALKLKGQSDQGVPHQLIMTATPIPRTLAMCAYADLDYSVIDELPPGRKPVKTLAVADHRRGQVIDRIREACGAGRQAYWVCTLIEESEALQCQAAETTASSLEQALPDLSIGLVHGRLKTAQKSQIMARFKAGEIDLLVATTVIEVGVDVPNANLMIIDNPERLGLAQLHQLRGRVGRSCAQSYCVLMYGTPLSVQARKRLLILRETNDGFKIAEEDMAIRGPGEVMGTRQTGIMTFKVADLLRDQFMLADVRRCAQQVLSLPFEQQRSLLDRWQGGNQIYSQV